jgi:hypothetical protein
LLVARAATALHPLPETSPCSYGGKAQVCSQTSGALSSLAVAYWVKHGTPEVASLSVW